MPNRISKLIYVFLSLSALLSVLAALGMLIKFPFGLLEPDSYGYLQLLYGIVKQRSVYGVSGRVLGYPIFLVISSLGQNLTYTVIIQYILFFLSAFLIYKISYLLTESKLFSGLIATLNLYNLQYFKYCHYILTESPSTFLTTLIAFILVLLYKEEKARNYLYLSLSIGIAILFRPGHQILILILMAAATRLTYFWLKNRISSRDLCSNLSFLIAPAALLILSQMTYVYFDCHEFGLTSSEWGARVIFVTGGDLVDTNTEPYRDVKQAIKGNLELFHSPDFPYIINIYGVPYRNVDYLIWFQDGPLPIIQKMYPDRKWTEVIRVLGIDGIKNKPSVFLSRGISYAWHLLRFLQFSFMDGERLRHLYYTDHTKDIIAPDDGFGGKGFYSRYTETDISQSDSKISRLILRIYLHVCSWLRFFYFYIAYFLFLAILAIKWRCNIFIFMVYLLPVLIAIPAAFTVGLVIRYTTYYTPIQITLGGIFYLEACRMLIQKQ